jgi:hypothetical protein
VANTSKLYSRNNKDIEVGMQNRIHLYKALDMIGTEQSDIPKHHFLAAFATGS